MANDGKKKLQMQNLVKNQGVDGKKHSISEMTVNRLQAKKKV